MSAAAATTGAAGTTAAVAVTGAVAVTEADAVEALTAAARVRAPMATRDAVARAPRQGFRGCGLFMRGGLSSGRPSPVRERSRVTKPHGGHGGNWCAAPPHEGSTGPRATARRLDPNGPSGSAAAARIVPHGASRPKGRGGGEAAQADSGARSGRAALGETWRALRSVFAKPALRRMQLALAASLVGDWAPGDSFGEIGLLRTVPRTATVTATEDTELLTLTREDFLGAVQGTDASMAAAYDIVTSRLG